MLPKGILCDDADFTSHWISIKRDSKRCKLPEPQFLSWKARAKDVDPQHAFHHSIRQIHVSRQLNERCHTSMTDLDLCDQDWEAWSSTRDGDVWLNSRREVVQLCNVRVKTMCIGVRGQEVGELAVNSAVNGIRDFGDEERAVAQDVRCSL